jgi:hypothetical protein
MDNFVYQGKQGRDQTKTSDAPAVIHPEKHSSAEPREATRESPDKGA